MVVMIMILVTGNPFVREFTNVIIFFFGLGCILFFLYSGNRIKKDYVALLSVQIIVLILPIFLIEPSLENMTHYLKLIFLIVSVQMYMKLVDINTFKNTYINIIYFLCLTSLVMYLILIAVPQIQNYLPVSYTNAGIAYKNFGLLIWHADSVELRRNYSIFWEPGVFTAIAVYALILGMDLRSPISNKFFIVIVCSLLLSGSTVAFILVPLFVIHRILKHNKIKVRSSIYRLLLLAVAVVLVMLVWLGYVEFANNPLNKFSFENQSFNNRYLSLITDYQIFSEGVMGVGPDEYSNRVWIYSGEVLGSSFNSILFSLAIYGLPFTLVSLLLYFYSINSLHMDRLAKYIAQFSIVIIFFTQLLMYSILFLCFAAIYVATSSENRYLTRNKADEKKFTTTNKVADFIQD